MIACGCKANVGCTPLDPNVPIQDQIVQMKIFDAMPSVLLESMDALVAIEEDSIRRFLAENLWLKNDFWVPLRNFLVGRATQHIADIAREIRSAHELHLQGGALVNLKDAIKGVPKDYQEAFTAVVGAMIEFEELSALSRQEVR